jgi:hypothetical protein
MKLAVPPTMQAMMILGNSEGLLSTHPTVADRIAALKAYAGAKMPVNRVRLASALPASQQTAFGRRNSGMKR